MTELALDGLTIHHETAGDGPPLVLVHGSWDDLHTWDLMTPLLTGRFTVTRYDRRGHGHSTCPPGQGSIGQDVDDLEAVLERVVTPPAVVVGHSYGSTVALTLGLRRPDLVRTLVVHEPPLFGLLAGTRFDRLRADAGARMAEAAALLEQDRSVEGARHFVEHVAFGPGSWRTLLDDDMRRRFVAHRHTWLDQSRDPDRLALDVVALAGLRVPVTLSVGNTGLPGYRQIAELIHAAVTGSTLATVSGAGHAPHWTHPLALAELVARYASN